jgi:prefoldin subunit 5
MRIYETWWIELNDYDPTDTLHEDQVLVVLKSDYDALKAKFDEAIALLHADLGAYKSEIPHIAEAIEDFLTSLETGEKHGTD